jgi:Predicted membrane protein (DUF2306)
MLRSMKRSRSTALIGILALTVGLLILKVTFSVVLGYRDYFPPNFNADFLRGRETYFFGAYQWAFYAHIASGPITLILGLILMSERFRLRFSRWHRSLGKAQIALVALVLSPSGFWLALYARTGAIAAMGFAMLAIVTGMVALIGWQSAMKRRFVEHRRWMWRLFLLLSSAVIVRLVGGFAMVFDVGAVWIYPFTAWAGWLVPLAAYESVGIVKQTFKRLALSGKRHLATPAAT